MHLVSDPEQYSLAIERKLPFFRTACDRVEPLAVLTTDPRLVTCMHCQHLINQLLASAPPEPVPVPAPVPSEPLPPLDDSDDELDAFDAVDSAFDGDSASTSPPSPSPSASSDFPPGALQPMLEVLFKDFEVDPLWERWTMTPEEDPQGSEGMSVGDFDLREVLGSEQAKFLSGLAKMSKLAGLEGVSSRVLTLLHQVVLSGVDDPHEELDDHDGLGLAHPDDHDGRGELEELEERDDPQLSEDLEEPRPSDG